MFSFLCKAVSSRIKPRCVLSFALLMDMVVLSGCFGGAALYTVECESDYPLINYIYTKDNWGEGSSSANPLDKDDFLEDWGKADEIVTISPEKEMWVYKRNEFCGLIPIWGIPVPLVASCDDFDHITFENDKAIHIHFKLLKYFIEGGGDCYLKPRVRSRTLPGQGTKLQIDLAVRPPREFLSTIY